MNINTYWTLIDKWRAESGGDAENFCSVADRTLNAMGKKEAQDFAAITAAYLNFASECVWLDMACKVINGYVSDDTALYFALWVIAQGKKALLEALTDPDSLSYIRVIPFGNADFELLMGVGTDNDFEPDDENPFTALVEPEIKYKYHDKYGGFTSFDAAMQAIEEHLPKLTARAEAEGFNWRNHI